MSASEEAARERKVAKVVQILVKVHDRRITAASKARAADDFACMNDADWEIVSTLAGVRPLSHQSQALAVARFREALEGRAFVEREMAKIEDDPLSGMPRGPRP